MASTWVDRCRSTPEPDIIIFQGLTFQLKVGNMGKDIEGVENFPDAVTLATRTLDGLLAVLTGIATSEKKDWALSLGHLVQRARARHFLKGLLQEIRAYRERGEIKDDYFSTEQGMNCMQEILEFLDKDSPDEIRFNVMRTIFLKIATEKMSERTDIVPVQLMRIARSLSSGEVLVLLASHKVFQSQACNKDTSSVFGAANAWSHLVTEAAGLDYQELVEVFERPLIEKLLLSERVYGDKSGFKRTKFYLLTPLGFRLCEFMSEKSN